MKHNTWRNRMTCTVTFKLYSSGLQSQQEISEKNKPRKWNLRVKNKQNDLQLSFIKAGGLFFKLAEQVDGFTLKTYFLFQAVIFKTLRNTTDNISRCKNGHLKQKVCQPSAATLGFKAYSKGQRKISYLWDPTSLPHISLSLSHPPPCVCVCVWKLARLQEFHNATLKVTTKSKKQGCYMPTCHLTWPDFPSSPSSVKRPPLSENLVMVAQISRHRDKFVIGLIFAK